MVLLVAEVRDSYGGQEKKSLGRELMNSSEQAPGLA